MTSKDLFAVCVRVIGLISLMLLFNSLALMLSAPMPWELVVRFVIWFVLAVWMLRGAPALIRFAYPDRTERL